MGKTLYLECNSGISGDMTVASLLDLGADWDYLLSVLKTVKTGGYEVKQSRVKKVGIDCMDFDVVLEHDNHDHDMEYLHGHEHDHEHEHDHDHEHNHEHDHHHDHEHHHNHDHNHNHEHHHHHEHRGMKEIIEIIDSCEMTERARKIAKRIFEVLAEAESKSHGVPIEEVHFHEVGAIDSIVDIISVAVCLDNLDIDQVIVPSVCEGKGTVRCQHGILSIPVPAVANIMSAYELPIEFTNVKGELITPTGAAIIAALQTSNKLPDKFVIKKIGLGAGKRNYERPSILRAMLIEEKKQEEDWVYKLESNIDDCTGEEMGLVMELLFAAGARDVHYTPVFMKKNRPGYQLNVICSENKVEELEQIIFKNTTTIGIRKLRCERSVLAREIIKVNTSYGEVRVKKCTGNDFVKYYPEYDDVAKISKETGVAYKDIYMKVAQEAATLQK